MGSPKQTALTLLACSTLAASLTACGNTSDPTVARARLAAGGGSGASGGSTGKAEGRSFLKSDGDDDRDDHRKTISDDDESELVDARRYRSTTAQHAAIRRIVKAYYAAAASNDGTAGCALLTTTLSSSLSPSQENGRSRICAQTLSRLFAAQRSHIAAEDSPTMVLTGVHVHDNVAFVTLGFRFAPEGELVLQREHHKWRLNALFDSGLP